MKKINIILTIIGLLIIAGFGSCKKDAKIGGTAVQSLAGEWWVQIDDGTGFSTDYYKFTTYNTAANLPTEMWFDDYDAVFGVKGKVTVDVSKLSFSGSAVANEYSDGPTTFTITNGLVVKGGAVAPGSGDNTNAISFTGQFNGDPTVYKFKGYARTGFSQDDH